MCGFQDALSNLMPTDWLDPYGRTPFAKDAELSVDITIVETEDGIRAKSVKNPPTSGSNRLMNAIKNALGVDMVDSMSPCSSSQPADQDKQDDMISNDKKEKPDTMKPPSSGDSEKQGSQPWSSGKSPEGPAGKSQEKDAKEKAPKF